MAIHTKSHRRTAHHQFHHHHSVTTSSILRTMLKRFLSKPPLLVWVLGFLVGPLFLWYHSRTEANLEAYRSLDALEETSAVKLVFSESLASEAVEERATPAEGINAYGDSSTNAPTRAESGEASPTSLREESTKPKVTKAMAVISRINSLSNAASSPTSRASSVKSSNAAVKTQMSNVERSR